jgi:hypothetical protein
MIRDSISDVNFGVWEKCTDIDSPFLCFTLPEADDELANTISWVLCKLVRGKRGFTLLSAGPMKFSLPGFWGLRKAGMGVEVVMR